ncbi:MAG: type VI secretion system tip protein VgrG [Myxococcales bacterium]|nr:type VI secretion system tip protein VgrG [Myxococcales bacterium]
MEAFEGHERLNALYRHVFEGSTRGDPGDVQRWVGERARFTVVGGERQRTVHGIVASVRDRGGRRDGDSEGRYVDVELAPHARLMTLRRSSNVFQGLSIVEVVQRVLARYRIPSRWLLTKPVPQRAMCVQYEETDLAFVERLLAEAGIVYFFEQPHVAEDGSLLDPARYASQVLQQAAGALAGAIPEAGNAIATGASLVGSFVEPREVMVMADHASLFPDLDTSDSFLGVDPAQLSRALGGAAARRASALAEDAIGGPAGEIVGGLAERALDELLADSRGSATVLPFVDDAGALVAGGDAIFEMSHRRAVHTLAAAFRAYDPRHPLAPVEGADMQVSPIGERLEEWASAFGDAVPQAAAASQAIGQAAGQAAGQAVGQAAGQASGDAAGGAIGQVAGLIEDIVGPPLEIYDHHSPFSLPDREFESQHAKRGLLAAQRDAEVVDGDSNCFRLSAGYRFAVQGHPTTGLNRDFTVVAVEHRASRRVEGGERAYHATFRAVPAETLYAPEPPPRRCIQACETATVVGGEEIFTNDSGEVHIRFHWDRRRSTGLTSCWVRVAQPWAGRGFGAQFLPRRGTEVVVAFEGGDPDRPLIVGSVYNAVCRPPFALPDNRTVSGWSTRSVPGGDGYNVLSFDDRRGDERVYLRAERDYQREVRHDERIEVGHDAHHAYGERRETRVGGREDIEISGGRHLVVGPSDEVIVGGSASREVQSDARETIRGDATTEIRGALRTEVGAGASHTIQGDSVTRVSGSLVQSVGTDGGASHITHVEGEARLFGSSMVEVGSRGEITLRCGDSSIQLSPDRIHIQAPEIVLQAKDSAVVASDEIRFDASSVLQGIADKVLLKASGAAVGLSSEASIDGRRVLLNSPQQASDQVDESAAESTTIELVDQDGRAVANWPYRIVKADGSVVGGTLDHEGKAELFIEEDAEITFPGICDVTPG